MKARIFILLFCFVLPFSAFTQIDSLLNKWSEVEGIEGAYLEKANLAFEICEYYLSKSPQKSMFYSKKYFEYSEAAHDTDHIFQAYANMGINYYYLDEMQKSLKCFKEFYDFAVKCKRRDGIAMASNNLGNIYMDVNHPELSIQNFKRALNAYKESNNREAQSFIYNNMGNAYSMQEKYDSALQYFNQSLRIKEELKDKQGQANTFNNIGELYQKWGNYPKAIDYFNKSLTMKTSLNDYVGMASTLESIGLVYLQLKDYSKSMESFNNSLYLARQHEINYYVSENLKNISDAYSHLKDFQKSYYYLHAYLKFHDSINAGADTLFSPDIKLTNQLEEKDQRIKLLTNELTENNGNNSQGHRLLVIAIAIIVVLLILLLAFNFSVKKYKLVVLEKEKSFAYLRNDVQRLSQVVEGLEEKVTEKSKLLKLEEADKKRLQRNMTDALEKAERMNKLKTEFLANISHEIRTPLNGVIGFTDLLANELEDSDTPYLYEYAKEAYESGMRLLNLLNNIIDISRFEANDFDITPVVTDINDVVKNVFDLFTFAANDKGLVYEMVDVKTPAALAYKEFLSKSLSYLIDNAIKYTNEGTVTIGMGYLDQTEEIFIRISDTGVGISKEYLPHVFESFSQESTGPTRKYQGSGLGLSLARRFVEAMGGHLEIDSEKDEGTHVTIYLKSSSARIPEKMSEKFIRQEMGKKQPNIFIVEDNEMNALLLKTMLKEHANVSFSEDGDDSLRLIEEKFNENIRFDLMLFDINLPYPWDGIALMNEVKRRWKDYKNIPFVAQTAYAHRGDKERFLEAGFDAYVPKPIDKKEFYQTLADLLDIEFKEK